jgi:TPR repeat protein
VPQDLERGKNWLERAAAQGHTDSIKLLNFLVEIGRDTTEVYHQSGDELEKLANEGDLEAQYQLALRYETGAWGVFQDDKKALFWFERAARAGHTGAIASLVHVYERGLLGVKPDPAKAAEWHARLPAEEREARKPADSGR